MRGARPPDLFVLDLDGTVADTRDDIARSVNVTLAAEGRAPMTASDVWRCVGEGVASLMERVFGDGDEERLAVRVARFRDDYERHLLDSTRLYPGVTEFFSRARAAVLTNKPERMSRRILDGLGVGTRVVALVGGDSVATRKPNPEGLWTIMNGLRVTRERTVLVGDSVVDLETARAAQVSFVGVSYGYSGRDGLVAAGAALVVDSLEELVA